MIFLSHTEADKPVVEPIAMKLRGRFGQSEVFYDDWSIQPGDGIVDRMNEGLSAPTHVFFFVSEKSLKSPMVKLEWQNSLYMQTKELTKMVPVRVDGAAMPAVLLQNRYVDLHTHGIHAAVDDIIKIVTGENTFSPRFENHSNLSWSVKPVVGKKELLITVSASHLAELDLDFMIVFKNTPREVTIWIYGAGGCERFRPEERYLPGVGNATLLRCKPFGGGSILPNKPLVFQIFQTSDAPLQLEAVLHKVGPNYYEPIPQLQA